MSGYEFKFAIHVIVHVVKRAFSLPGVPEMSGYEFKFAIHVIVHAVKKSLQPAG